MHRLKQLQQGMMLIFIPAILALVPTMAGAEMQPVGLGRLLTMAEDTAPAMVKAKRELETAKANLAAAQADLGWQGSVATGRATMNHAATGETSVDVQQVTAEISRVVAPGQAIALSADKVSYSLRTGESDFNLGPLTLGWSMRLAGTLPQVQAVKEQTRAVAQKEAALDQARETTVNQVASLYFAYLKAQLDSQVAQKQVDAYAKQLEKSQALAKVGRAIDLDVQIAEQRLAIAQADLASRAKQLELAWRDLTRQVGIAAGSLDVANLADATWQPEPVGAVDDYLAQADDRPEVRLAQLSVAAAEDAVTAARQTGAYNLKPLVSYDTDTHMVSVGADLAKVKAQDSDTNNLSASVRLTQNGAWSVSTSFATNFGGASDAAKQALTLSNAEANLATATADLARVKEDAQETIRSLWADLQAKKAQHELQATLLAREKLNHDTYLTQAQMGAVAPIDVADADFAYAQADVAAKKAMYDQMLAYIKLLAATDKIEALHALEGF